MLNLHSETDPGWAERCLPHLDVILLDHAHCEKKAASTAINLIFRYQDRAELMAPLSALAREELEHFEQVLAILQDRGIAFRRLRPSPYARELRSAVREQEPETLLDVLLCCSLIEARSCERMKLLEAVLPDPELQAFYRSLLACEARHHTTYVDMAAQIFGRDVTTSRLKELAACEAKAILTPFSEPRIHS